MKFDAVIIGAGAAGLAAARLLSGAGKNICILEARTRIGGRVFTLHFSDLPLPIELGAEFIHGQSATTLPIADAAALVTAELPDDHWWARGGEWERVDFWSEIGRVLAKIPPRGKDLSFAQFLRSRRDLSPRLRELACRFVEGYHAAHADRISTHVLRVADREQDERQPGGNRQYRILSGQSGLIEWLHAGLDPHRTDLRLGTVAESVQWSEGSVLVGCRAANRETERIRASALVVTIPIGVWKAPRGQEGAISFDPSLREKERAVALIEAGHVVKIAFRFRERFWADFNFLHTGDRSLPTWWTTAPVRSPILTGWAGGTAADTLLAERAEGLLDRALDALASAFRVPRRRLDALLVDRFTQDWQRDPFSRGAYSYAAVGGQRAHAALAKPVRKTLFFAGEATSGDETGTVAGAIASGFRAARELLRVK